MSASRSAVHLERPALRSVFAESALEEYSHCEDYFFVSKNPSLSAIGVSENTYPQARQVRSSSFSLNSW